MLGILKNLFAAISSARLNAIFILLAPSWASSSRILSAIPEPSASLNSVANKPSILPALSGDILIPIVFSKSYPFARALFAIAACFSTSWFSVLR